MLSSEVSVRYLADCFSFSLATLLALRGWYRTVLTTLKFGNKAAVAVLSKENWKNGLTSMVGCRAGVGGRSKAGKVGLVHVLPKYMMLLGNQRSTVLLWYNRQVIPTQSCLTRHATLMLCSDEMSFFCHTCTNHWVSIPKGRTLALQAAFFQAHSLL